tara:strand:+ start:1202 stop:1807 length:606 start_codon:yes stop_codon:yes gene_type:complete
MDRKKKLRIYQVIFLISGVIIILFTYLNKKDLSERKLISNDLQQKIEKKSKNQASASSNIFYNVKYSGLDLEGNRYTIFANESTNSEIDFNLIKMKKVFVTFYFKDNTQLKITSDEGDYNNKTLDIIFRKSVKANYEGSQLYADRAEFSNSNNFLTVSENVKIVDSKGIMFADNLKLDIKENTLNINSLKNNTVKSKIKYK